MPGTKIKNYKSLPEELKKQIREQVKTGLAAVEQDSRGYGSVNSQSNALGKYQFVPTTKIAGGKTWWDEIKKYGAENGFEVNEYKDFLKSPSFQEGFMDYYLEKHIFPQVTQTYNSGKNPENLSYVDMTMFYHFQSPETAKRAITQGKSAWRDKTSKKNGDKVDNSSMEKYLTRARAGITSSGMKLLDNQKFDAQLELNEKGADKIYDEYANKRDNILYNNKLNDDVQAARLAELNREYVDRGLDSVINKYSMEKAAEYDQKELAKYNQKKESLERLLGSLDEAEVFYSKKRAFANDKTKSQNIKLKDDIVLDEDGYAAASQLGLNAKKIGDGKYKVNLDSTFETLNKNFYEITGESLGLNRENFKLDENSDFDFDANFFTNLQNNGLAEMLLPNKATSSFSGSIDVSGDLAKKVRAGTHNAPTRTIPTRIDSTNTAPKVNIEETKPQQESTKPQQENKPAEETAETNTTTEEAASPQGLNFEELPLPQNFSYDKANYGQGQNIGNIANAAMGAGLAIKGFKDADVDIPMRDEQVNNAFLDYVKQIKDISEKGLSPAEEASMKKKITESYQVGVDNLTRASNGNRNLVLGNQGQLDAARMNSIVEVELADAAKKERALQQWGEAERYINEFDARREIANTQTKQYEAFQKRAQGQQLAASGLNLLTSSIDKAISEGPGSANHMYKSYLLQDMYGYDPRMKDDGSGTVKGTRSWYEKEVLGKIKQKNAEVNSFNSIYGDLNDSQKMAVEKVYNQNPNDMGGLIDFAEYAKTKSDFSKMDMSKYGKAVEGNDYNLMFREAQSVGSVATNPIIPQTTKPSAELIKQEDPYGNIFSNPDFLNAIADTF